MKSVLQIFHCLTPDDFTLSNARRSYSLKGDPLRFKGLKKLSPSQAAQAQNIRIFVFFIQ